MKIPIHYRYRSPMFCFSPYALWERKMVEPNQSMRRVTISSCSTANLAGLPGSDAALMKLLNPSAGGGQVKDLLESRDFKQRVDVGHVFPNWMTSAPACTSPHSPR